MADKIKSAVGVNELGFLSPDIRLWVDKHRAANPPGFSIASDLSRLGLQALHGVTLPPYDNRNLLAAILFTRCLTHYQSAIALAEMGASPSAKAILRVLCEGAFILGAMVKSPDFHQRHAEDDHYRQAELIAALLEMPREHIRVTDAEYEALKADLAALRKHVSATSQRKLRPVSIADEAGLLDFYHLFYVPYSNAVHSAVRDMESHYREDASGDIALLRFGPDSDAVDDVVEAANSIFFAVVDNVLQMFPQPEVREQFAKLWESQKAQLKASAA